VASVLPRKLAGDPVARRKAVLTRLAPTACSTRDCGCPARSDVVLVADVRVGQVRTSVDVPAPQEWSSTRRVARGCCVSWARGTGHLEGQAVFAGRTGDGVRAARRRAGPKPALLVGDKGLDIKAFRLTGSTALGTRRSGS
jgi:hypothetical protein